MRLRSVFTFRRVPLASILHITRDYPPRGSGGISTAVDGMVRHARYEGWSCQVISFDGWRPRATDLPATASVDEGETFRLSSPGGLEDARRFAARRPPRIVHVHDPLLWDFGAAVARNFTAATVLTVHVFHHAMNAFRDVKGETMSSLAESSAMGEANVLHVTTNWLAGAVSRARAGTHERIRIAPLGADDSTAAQRSRATAKDGPILYVGRFSDVKGTDIFIDALRHLGPAAGDILVVGGLPHNMKSESRWKARFEEAAPGRVHFRGWLSAEELAECYASARLLVVPSAVETFGQVALEGLMHGVPVLASRCPAFFDWLYPTQAAHFFEVGNARDLAEQITILLGDSDRRITLQRRGPEVAFSTMQWTRVFPALEAIYKTL